MDWFYVFLDNAFGTLCTFVILALLAKFLPAKNKTEEIQFSDFIRNPKKVIPGNLFFLLYLLILVPSAAYLFGLALEKLITVENHFSSNKAIIIVYPSFSILYTFSLLFLYALSCKPSDWLLKMIFKKHYQYYRQFIAYSEYINKIDHKKLTLALFVMLLFFASLCLFIATKSQIYFNSDSIEFYDFPSWRYLKYGYSDVSKIIQTHGFLQENGEVSNHEHFRIYFNDNNFWSSLSWNDLNQNTIDAVKLVSGKTGKSIEEIQSINK